MQKPRRSGGLVERLRELPCRKGRNTMKAQECAPRARIPDGTTDPRRRSMKIQAEEGSSLDWLGISLRRVQQVDRSCQAGARESALATDDSAHRKSIFLERTRYVPPSSRAEGVTKDRCSVLFRVVVELCQILPKDLQGVDVQVHHVPGWVVAELHIAAELRVGAHVGKLPFG